MLGMACAGRTQAIRHRGGRNRRLAASEIGRAMCSWKASPSQWANRAQALFLSHGAWQRARRTACDKGTAALEFFMMSGRIDQSGLG
jgi:hypothetical protein